MKKINHFYRRTKRDGSFEKAYSKLPDSPEGYSAIFSNFDPEDVDKILKAMSECGEDTHPTMYIPLSYIFFTTPAKAKAELDKDTIDGNALERFLCKILADVQEWVYLNKDLADELFELCGGVVKKPLQGDSFEVSNIVITPIIEDRFVGAAQDDYERLKRIKFLAAMNLFLVYSPLQQAKNDGNAELSAYFMFHFMRSLAQFAANRCVYIGLSQLSKTREGGGHTEDRVGLLTLIEKYHVKYPTETNEKLWGIIKKDLQDKKFLKPAKGYSVRFYEDYVNITTTSGTLIQTNKAGEEYPIQYKAFTSARGKLRN